MSKRIFLDLETTSTDDRVDQITEAAWILEDGSERQFFVEHDRLPNEWVLKNTDYVTRILPARKLPLQTVITQLALDCSLNPNDQYIVGACIAFDDRFLRRAFLGNVPYHYHVIDIEAMAMGLLGWVEPRSLKDLRAALGISGENAAPHTALEDAREVQTIFNAILLKATAQSAFWRKLQKE